MDKMGKYFGVKIWEWEQFPEKFYKYGNPICFCLDNLFQITEKPIHETPIN